MKKLTLEHLAPYLPYGLKSYVNFQGHHLIRDVDTNNVMVFVWGDTRSKPILSPLSDVPDDMFESFGFADEENFQYCVYSGIIPHSDWIRLVKEKYDVFGLIDAGLAIDINTLSDAT